MGWPRYGATSVFGERRGYFHKRLCTSNRSEARCRPVQSISFDEQKEVEGEPEHRSQLVQTHFCVCAK